MCIKVAPITKAITKGILPITLQYIIIIFLQDKVTKYYNSRIDLYSCVMF